MGGYVDVIKAKAPYAFFVLDDASGNFVDASGNARNAIAVHTITYRDRNIIPKDGRRTAKAGYVQISDWWSGLGSAFTLECLVARNSSGAQALFGALATPVPYMRVTGADGTVEWYTVSSGTAVTWTRACPANEQLQHVVLTYENSGKVSELTVNRKSLGAQVAAQVLSGTSEGLTFGSVNFTQEFAGWVGMFAYYSRRLTTAEIVENYEALVGRRAKTLAGRQRIR